ncbi:MAG: hypothetical protein AB7I30_16275 [Isosphaeraceae bacterium]
MSILSLFSGYKTYVAAVGLMGLAIYHVSLGEFETAAQAFLAALAAAGLRDAIAKARS